MSRLHSVKSKNCLFTIFILTLLAIILFRITIGVDLSDEAYYATFQDGWLKEGLSHSANLMIHQTAALLLFPFVYAYQAVVGSETGLILFLRILYALMSFGAMLTLYFFIKPLRGQFIAAMVFAFGVLFIPWSLPAPSYNTIGMYGMLTAITLFAIAMMRGQEKEKLSSILTFSSAFFWTCSIVAYPSLLLAFCGFIFITYFLLKKHAAIFNYLVVCGFLFSFALAALLFIFGADHLIQILKFSHAILQAGGLSKKLHLIYYVELYAHPIFGILCGFSFLSGVVIAIYPRFIFLAGSFLVAAIGYLIHYNQAALFLISHDIILIITLFGIFIPLNAIKRKDLNSKILGVMYGSSFFAALLTTMTATNGLFNFPIGGLLAACLSLAFFPYSSGELKKFSVHIILLIFSFFSMGYATFKFIYGEMYGNPLIVPAQRIHSGVFAGIKTSVQQARLITDVSSMLPQDLKGHKITLLGRLSGLYLLTSLSPSTLATWSYDIEQASAAGQLINFFYQQKENLPDLIIEFMDPWGRPLSDAEKSLLKKYEIKNQYAIENQSVVIYQKSRHQG